MGQWNRQPTVWMTLLEGMSPTCLRDHLPFWNLAIINLLQARPCFVGLYSGRRGPQGLEAKPLINPKDHSRDVQLDPGAFGAV